MNPEKYTTLLYLSDDIDFGSSMLTMKDWDPEWYYVVRQMPTAEMFGADIVQLAEEMIQMSVSADWRRQQRRPIMCGDIICKGNDPWMYIRFDDMDIPMKDASIVRLTRWPNYGLISIPRKTVETVICKQ
jgi:hypothetical protein